MIGIALYTALTASSSITDVVGQNIYPVAIPQAVTGPCIVYAIGSSLPNPTKDGPSTLDTVLCDVFCIAKHYAVVDSLAETIRTTLEAYTASEIQSIRYQTESDDFDQETEQYIRQIQFKIRKTR